MVLFDLPHSEHFSIGRISNKLNRWRRFELTNWNFSVDAASVRRRLDWIYIIVRRPVIGRPQSTTRPASDQSTSDLSCRQWNINNTLVVGAGCQPVSSTLRRYKSAVGVRTAKVPVRLRTRGCATVLSSIAQLYSLLASCTKRSKYWFYRRLSVCLSVCACVPRILKITGARRFIIVIHPWISWRHKSWNKTSGPQ